MSHLLKGRALSSSYATCQGFNMLYALTFQAPIPQNADELADELFECV